MTSTELYKKKAPSETHKYTSQWTNHGLNNNISDIFNKLIKDAARTNRFQSDVYYSLKSIEEMHNEFNGEIPEPIWIGFRRDGVDGTNFVLATAKDSVYDLNRRYFALYSIAIEEDPEYKNFYYVIMNEYWM